MSSEKNRPDGPYPLIRDTATPYPRLDPDEVAIILGAESKHAIRRHGGGPITVYAIRERLLAPNDSLPENRVVLSDREIEQMALLVREQGTLSPAASAAQILRAFLHLALNQRAAS